jgi:hypothetical protein
MIATKTTTLVVAMAIIGIVPVAAHAQSVDIIELLEQSGTAEQISAPSQDQDQATVNDETIVQTDEDTFTPTNVVFATVGPNGTVTSTNANVFEDSDTQTIDDADTQTASGVQGQEAAATQTPTQSQSSSQIPTLTVGDLLGLLPTGG